ncbi:hypothetical protein AOL_s00054g471 [Orbilia oligospora ATCC 24927]|uniref:Uncharacterized protein n=1 Tax=Arthrobotrys oligospora (strain ATCC 24927 / CBS 115.81 / DSM 1491) TaxID=756982 RepID=G1X6H7_ARTOA|nr:hypothetical protein AOL_s00054g471 [Orbilia oligospora ATCC 24927]EGX51235.1 hypothetical protein AOL_s00054g471 [Orbilia oligospora ATCC 24927]
MSKVASLSKDIYTYITTSSNFLYYFSKYAYAPDDWLWYFTGTEIEGRSAFTMADTIGDSSDYKGLYHHGGTHFYYYLDDPDTLEKQLKEAYMVGLIDWDRGVDQLGRLYLIGYDDMKQIHLGRTFFASAVYPASLSHLARLYVGGEELRRIVRPHQSFMEPDLDEEGRAKKKSD